MSWKAEVIADASGKWLPNYTSFATRQEADDFVADLMRRWSAVRGWRTVESTEPVSHSYRAGKLRAAPFKLRVVK